MTSATQGARYAMGASSHSAAIIQAMSAATVALSDWMTMSRSRPDPRTAFADERSRFRSGRLSHSGVRGGGIQPLLPE